MYPYGGFITIILYATYSDVVPTPPELFILTENGLNITTEAGTELITE